jgi:hypothetical protein
MAMIGLMMLVLLVAHCTPVPNASAQNVVTIDVEILVDFTKVNLTNETNLTVNMDGTVDIEMPNNIPFLVVDVDLDIVYMDPHGNFSVTVEPDRMSFTGSDIRDFVLTVVVPHDLENVTEMNITVEGTAASDGIPTATDHDEVAVMFEYPAPEEPEEPQEPDIPDVGPHPLIFCGISILIGLVVAALVYWNKNIRRRGQRRKGRTEVVYVPRKGAQRPK